MTSTSVAQKIQNSSLVHITLLDEFIRVTEEKLDTQSDAFVRESLNELLASLRDEREGYVQLTLQPVLAAA